jgi:cell pole-organizing protein PopZ
MSDTNAQEPTMEEILASIRRIISEDDAPQIPSDATAEASAQVQTMAPPEDDVLELTEPLAPEPAPQFTPAPVPISHPTFGDLDVSEPSPAPVLQYQAPAKTPEPLVSGTAASLAASHFGALSKSIAMPAEGRTLEDVVTALLHPLLKDWLDTHLPGIVEAKVRDEVERISRGR